MAESDPYAAFRLNLEQQRKRAKDVLRARRAADARDFKLTDAQFTIARELGFPSWMALRAHIMAQTAERAAMEQSGPPLDTSMRTLHIRCGTDIKRELEAAGFSGDFLSVWDTFPVGPVTAAPDWIAQRARFHADTDLIDPDFATLLADLTADNQRLATSADEYERVVIWMEHDSHDQLALVRCLAQYAKTRPPHVLELISVNHFPGSRRFIGFGQLPPEAMRLLWLQRERLGPSHLALGAEAWSGLTADDPRGLAALMRTGTPALPHLAPALHRHLQELPSRATGLGLTQFLILQLLDESASTIGDLWVRYGSREPLPFLATRCSYTSSTKWVGRVCRPWSGPQWRQGSHFAIRWRSLAQDTTCCAGSRTGSHCNRRRDGSEASLSMRDIAHGAGTRNSRTRFRREEDDHKTQRLFAKL